MRRRTFIIPIAAIAIFFIGFYHEPINNYFNTIDTIIGLLFTVILLLVYWILKLKDSNNKKELSYQYIEGQGSYLNKQIREKDDNIKELKDKNNLLEHKLENLHESYQNTISDLNNKIYNLKTNKDE